MTLVSYAQNFEDVMLWRALGHIESGFYIDVGANDPDVDSITRAFYDRGWCGINIEPMKQWFGRLKQARPRDTNLCLAAGAAAGETILHGIPDTGLSTSLESIARRHEAELGFSRVELSVEVETLNSICKRFEVQTVHFLKIDVEGAERDVLLGLDLAVVRPWVIVIEATRPMSRVSDHGSWEPLILSSSYVFAYFDGLNRYYVAAEHAELMPALSLPPNVFDEFSLSGTASHSFCTIVNARADELQAQFSRSEAAFLVERMELHAKASQSEAAFLQQRLEWHAKVTQSEAAFLLERQERLESTRREGALRQSFSWRVTAPLRAGKDAVTRLDFAWKCKRVPLMGRSPFRAVLQWGLRRSTLVNSVHRVLRHWPWMHRRIAQAVSTTMSFSAPSSLGAMNLGRADELTLLTPRGRDIHKALIAAKNREERS